MTRRLPILVLVVALATGLLAGCATPPPIITQEQADARVVPEEHPKLTVEQSTDCTGCHKVD